MRKTLFLIIFSAGFIFASNLLLAADEDTAAISGEAFTNSSFSEFFRAGDLEKALDAVRELLKEYPGDRLLRRYEAITLDQLGQSDRAIKIFKELLEEDPGHAPTRYFLAQAYAQTEKRNLAMEEWKWVVENAAGSPYAEWAQESIKGLPVPERPSEKTIRRWRIIARYGYEFDSNVTLRPNDDSLASGGDNDAGRQSASLSMRYRPYSRRDLAVDLEYLVSQTVHDDGLNEFNFHTEEFGVNVKKRVNLFDRDMTLGARHQFSMGFLEKDLFSNRNRTTLSLDSRLTKFTRTILANRFSVTNFGPDGFLPNQTSRDGVYNDAGITQYWYAKNFKRYVYAREEFNSGHTRGRNFDYVGNTTRVGAHTPITEKISLDASSGLQFRHYHNFSSLSTRDRSRRKNFNWDLYVGLSYRPLPNVSIRGFYRYIRSLNRNNFFDYTRNIFGGEMIFAELF